MKTSRITFLALLFAAIPTTFVSAQKTLAQRMTADFCKELDNQDIDKWNEQTMEKIGLAMIPIATKYADEIKKEYGLEMKTQTDFEQFGRIIGAEAAISCPKFQKLMENMVSSKVEEAKSTASLDGTFLGLDTSGSFACLKVKDADGREQKIWWFEHFDGSETLVKTPSALNNKKVTVVYVEREVYEPKLKDYVKIKVASSLKTN